MKIYVKSSRSNKSFILAKGIVFLDMYDKYSDYIHNNPYISEVSIKGYPKWYLAFTEATYDPVTGSLDGEVLNHQSLLDKINFPHSLETHCVYFSVDLSSSGQGTELSVSNQHRSINSEILAFLKKEFKVSDSRLNTEGEWLDLDSTEFKQRFREAAKEAKELTDMQHKHTNYGYTGDPGYYVPRFGITFAVVDPVSRQGVVNSGPDFLFVSDDFKDYTRKKKKFAGELGFYSNELIYKTVFSDNYTGGKGDDSDENTGKGMRNALRDLVYQINAEHPDFKITVNPVLNWAMAVKQIGGKQCEIRVQIEPTVLDNTLDIDKGSLMLPNHAKHNISEVISDIEEAFNTCY